jgi:putative SOS response-associated peptidase YedK
VVESCTLLVTEANDTVRPIHDRMPVILAPEDYAAWLDPREQDPARLAPLLRPCPAEGMRAWRVGRRVNSPANDDPECLEPED